MLIAISGGTNTSKKPKSLIRKKIRYLNYGLLGLATLIKKHTQKNIMMFQGDNLTPEELINVIRTSGIDIQRDCSAILLSIPSSYSILWCKEFCSIIKRNFNKKIIAGGRWVVDQHTEWIKAKIPDIDIIVLGFGEQALLDMFSEAMTIRYDGSKRCFDLLDYRILHEYYKYQPCIEISRGCGCGCQFCADRDSQRTPNKSVQLIQKELEFIDTLYPNYSIYFEAPHFVFEPQWTLDFCQMLTNRPRKVPWRCTTRVETFRESYLPLLSSSGLKILDIGLESASERQLLRMQKTSNPAQYLKKADKLLEECSRNNVWVKFNLLLYAGETRETLEETITWLLNRKDLIKDISVSGLVYYHNMDSIDDILQYGASIPSGMSIDDSGYVNLNLSSEIDAITAQELSVLLPKKIANQRDFYDIKAISYFENGYSYQDFLADLEKCDINTLPFTIE